VRRRVHVEVDAHAYAATGRLRPYALPARTWGTTAPTSPRASATSGSAA